MALNSYTAARAMEDNNMGIFRVGNILDLSFVEQSSPLHRYQIGVIIHHIKTKSEDVEYFDKFRIQEVIE